MVVALFSLLTIAKRGFNEMELRIFAGWTKESNMPATYLHLSGADIEKKILAKNGIIEDDSKEREHELKPIECPRCKTKNPIGAKYCMTCPLILDQKTAFEVDQDKTMFNMEMMKAALTDPKILEKIAKAIEEK